MRTYKINIAQALKESGLTISELNRASGVSRQTIYSWLIGETSTVSLPKLAAICQALNVTPNDVLTLSEVEE